MSQLTMTALNPDVSVDVTEVPATSGVFRSNLNANIGAIEDKAQLVCASLEKLQAVLGNALISGGAAHLGTGLTIHVAAFEAFVGTWLGFDAEQTIGGFTDEDTTYLFLRQDGTWTLNLTGANPTDTETHGAFLLFAEVDATSAATCEIRALAPRLDKVAGLHEAKTLTSDDSPYTLNNQRVLLVNSASGNVTINLPTAVTQAIPVTVKKIHSSNSVTIDGYSSQTIDGATTKVLTTNYSSVTLLSDGANWHIVSSHTP